MQEDGHDPLNLLWSKEGLEGGCTLAFATLCGRGQQGLVKDVAQLLWLRGELDATKQAAEVSYQTGGYSWETPIFHCMAAEWDQ